jgi:hypothetical protein
MRYVVRALVITGAETTNVKFAVELGARPRPLIVEYVHRTATEDSLEPPTELEDEAAEPSKIVG